MDEPKEPLQMPRRPDSRKPEPKKKLRKADQERINEVALDQQLLSVDERACALLSTEYNREHAALTMDWTLEAVESTLNLPHVRLFIQKADEAFMKEIAKAKVRRMLKVGISKANVEQRLMDLAQTDPADTRGNIDGQVKALRTLAEILGMLNNDDPLKGKSREELEGFVTKSAARLLPGTQTPTPVQ
jgi:hypothetical protein